MSRASSQPHGTACTAHWNLPPSLSESRHSLSSPLTPSFSSSLSRSSPPPSSQVMVTLDSGHNKENVLDHLTPISLEMRRVPRLLNPALPTCPPNLSPTGHQDVSVAQHGSPGSSQVVPRQEPQFRNGPLQRAHVHTPRHGLCQEDQLGRPSVLSSSLLARVCLRDFFLPYVSFSLASQRAGGTVPLSTVIHV